MSADNWRNCPRCGAEDSLREDYEFYWCGKVFNVCYSGICMDLPGQVRGQALQPNATCGFRFEFQHQEESR